MLLVGAVALLGLGAPATATAAPPEGEAPDGIQPASLTLNGAPIFEETFSNMDASEAPIGLLDYRGSETDAHGETYTADPQYLPGAEQCNGWILNTATPLPDLNDAHDECDRGSAWLMLKSMSSALGEEQGHQDPSANQSLTEFSNSRDGRIDPGVLFETTQNAIPAIPGHSYAVSAYFAATSCNAANPSLTFSLVVNGEKHPISEGLNPCDGGTPYGGGTILVKQLVSEPITVPHSGPVTLGLILENEQPSGSGNDLVFDLPQILDVTPSLTLQKQVDNSAGGHAEPTDWMLHATGADSVPVLDGVTGVTGEVDPGQYQLFETGGPEGYELTGLTCVDGDRTLDTTVVNPQVDIDYGMDVVCTFTNSSVPASWTTTKSVDPESGSTVQPGSTITYTIDLVKTGGVFPDEATVTDDLSDVLDDAQWIGADAPDGSTATLDSSTNTLTWNLTAPDVEHLVLTYQVRVSDDAYSATLTNHVTPPSGDCLEGDVCSTVNYTSGWSLSKTSDPASGSEVEPGATITYTLHAVNTSQVTVSGAVAKDDIGDVVNDAELVLPLPDGLTRDGDTLTWHIPDMEPGADEVTVSYVVRVNDDASAAVLKNVAVADTTTGGTCDDQCATTHSTPGSDVLPDTGMSLGAWPFVGGGLLLSGLMVVLVSILRRRSA